MPDPIETPDPVARLASRPSEDLAALLLRERDRKDGEIRDLKRALKAAKTAVPEGGRVLTKDEAAALEGFTKLGTLAEITKRLADGESAVAKAAGYELRQTMADVVKAHGYSADGAADVLADLATRPDKGFATEKRTEEVNGEDTPVWYARPSGDDKAPWVKLPEFLQQHHPAYVPALTPASGGAERKSGTTPRTSANGSTATSGAPYPPQAGGSAAPKADNLFQRIRDDRAAEREKATAAAKPLEERLGKLAGV